ncbi:hypothetical protein Tco_1546173 [Tanacetum coccineum]
MEALNVSLLEATNNNIFHGIKVGKDNIHISHLQFVDDALIMGEWSCSNAKNLSTILTFFHLASGLKVNFNKSKLYGIGTSNVELCCLASTIGCLASQFPCTYLGLPIDAKMSPTNLKVFEENFFWGGSLDDKKNSWIAWDNVISPYDQGGPGIGSLRTCLSFVQLADIEPPSPLSHLGLNFTCAWPREPKRGPLLKELSSMVNLFSNLFLLDVEYCWEFTSDDSRRFSVKGMRSLISSSSQIASLPVTSWNKVMALKINIIHMACLKWKDGFLGQPRSKWYRFKLR